MRATISLIAGFFAYFALGVGGVQAQEARWTLIESSGSVFVAQPLVTPRLVSLQEKLAPGSMLTTGGNGRAVVRRGGQDITIGPNSRISLPTADTGGMTKILQDFGAAMFKVDKRGVQHFQVDTPMIAAVVKGTTFTVSVAAGTHSVHVVEGLVEVSNLSGGPPVPVRAGATAFVAASNPGRIELIDTSTGSGDTGRGQPLDIAPTDGSEQRADASSTLTVAALSVPQTIGGGALDFERLTDGLVQPARAPEVSVSSAIEINGAGGASDSIGNANSQTVRSVIAGGNGNANPVVGSIPSGNPTSATPIGNSNGNAAGGAMPSGNPVSALPIANGNGNSAGGAGPIGNPISSGIPAGNGNGNSGGGAGPIGNPISSSVPAGNGNGNSNPADGTAAAGNPLGSLASGRSAIAGLASGRN
jgi:hypothetical protein